MRLLPFVFAVLFSGCAKEQSTGSPPLELRLKLSRHQWQAGEYLWYLLELKNIGSEAYTVEDKFWNSQYRLAENAQARRGTYFVVTGPDGREIEPYLDWGHHGELAFWRNETSGYKSSIAPGGTLTATPSVVEPPRRHSGFFSGPSDLRTLPSESPRYSKKQIMEMQQKWRDEIESKWLMGQSPYRTDPSKPPKPRPAGYRVLEGYVLEKPGKYRIKVVYDMRAPLPVISASEQISNFRDRWEKNPDPEYQKTIMEEWQSKTPAELNEIRNERKRTEEYNREMVHIESESIEFEVMP